MKLPWHNLSLSLKLVSRCQSKSAMLFCTCTDQEPLLYSILYYAMTLDLVQEQLLTSSKIGFTEIHKKPFGKCSRFTFSNTLCQE